RPGAPLLVTCSQLTLPVAWLVLHLLDGRDERWKEVDAGDDGRAAATRHSASEIRWMDGDAGIP
ncbi:Hypothetical predicted protein, partial [Pelobates cultripes]